MKHFLILLLFCFAIDLQAQEKQAQFSEIDELIETVYSVISGPKGERDWSLFQSLFHEKAIMGMTLEQKGEAFFKAISPEEYIKMNSPMFKDRAFYEVEIDRKVNKYGGVAQVFSSYQFGFEKDKFIQKGINSFQLVFADGRWYITQLIWQPETPELPLPSFKKQ